VAYIVLPHESASTQARAEPHPSARNSFMTPATTCAIIFVCLYGGALLGMLLRKKLSEQHLSPESKDVVKLGMGLIGTLAALVLGLLVASAKSSFDTQRNGVAQLAANIIVMDRALAHYGEETQNLRKQLQMSVEDMVRRTWPEELPQSERPEGKGGSEGRYEDVYDKILALSPKNDAQRTLREQALKIATDTMQARWLLFTQRTSSIPIPFLVVMVFWLILILTSFGLFAPGNITSIVSLFLCSLAMSTAIFLILELDRPFSGMIQISSGPMRSALEQLGRP
jgi:hypothetical protein